MNQFLSNKIIAGIVALALLVGVGVLVSSEDTSSTTRNAALVVATPCTKPGQVTKVSKQSVVCAALAPKNIWYPVLQEKKWICAKLGITRKQNGIFSVCGKSKSSKKRWFLTKPVMASSNPGLPTTDQDAFIKLTTNPELIVETSPTTPLALAATTETTVPPATETTLTPTTETTLAARTETTLAAKTTPTTTTPTTTTPTATTTTTTIPQTTTTTIPTTTIPRTYQVGDTGPGGGKVFYVAPTQQSWGRYLEAAPTDYQVNGSRAIVVWGCLGTSTDATATAIGTGKANTATILTKCTTAGIAADVTNKYSTSTAGAGQWFLPSRDELRLMYNNRDAIGGFSASYYWSSSEDRANHAWFYNFYAGWDSTIYNKSLANTYVRPVRAF